MTQFPSISQEQKSVCGETHTTAIHEAGQCPLIAIVGMGMRLPGGVRCADEFWDFLIQRKDGHCEVPKSRYSVEGFYDEYRSHTVKTKHGYFLDDDLSHFDAGFFSMTDYEAERLDPQQRMLLQVVWECLESAGETEWSGKDIGCYVGLFGEDWLENSLKDPQSIDRMHAVGTGHFALSNRVSYEFNFRGPSMTLLTGCSSSLIGMHEACQAIYSGECSSAIVAGTNLILSPTMTTTMSDNMVLSPSGRCKTFDEDADGYGRGEAINAIYIKPLDQAIEENAPIYAVIRSTSTNSDGKTPNITTPGSESQADLILRAYGKAGLDDISETGFFECHGTGTTVGDTSEVSAIAKLLEQKGIMIGAVKPNFGHSEGASGITSIMKAALALKHNMIPPNVNFNSPNPNIPWEEAKLRVPVEPTAWPTDRKQRISVNSFGIGGANAHAVLDSAVSCGVSEAVGITTCVGPQLLVVSAKSKASLEQRISDVTDYANTHPEYLADLVYTLALRREHLQHRAFAIVQPQERVELSDFSTSRSKPSEAVFVFTGQGSQWPGMGRELMEEFVRFREDMLYLDQILDEVAMPRNWSIVEQLTSTGDASRVYEAEIAQPLCTAVQIGLVNLLKDWGVCATAVLGHSSGEIAAAYASGAIDIRTAILIAFYRGRIVKTKDGNGAMLAIGLGREALLSYLLTSETVQIACENSNSSVTLSGDPIQLNTILQRIQEDHANLFYRWLRVKIAYHSNQMKSMGAAYEDLMHPHINFKDEMQPMFSSVTGEVITEPKKLDAAYWRRNLESPVLFYSAVTKILQQRTDARPVFIELGPHATLLGPLEQIFTKENPKNRPAYVPTLVRHSEENANRQLYRTLGGLFINSVPLKLSDFIPSARVLTNLPAYPWQHDRSYWSESRISKAWRNRRALHHELLGSQVVEMSDLEPSWRNILRLEESSWLADHVVQGKVIFPAAGFISMVGEAVKQLDPGSQSYSIRDFYINDSLLLEEMKPVELVTSLKPVKINDSTESEWYAFSILSSAGNEFVKHCHGEVRSGFDILPESEEIPDYVRLVDEDKWYQVLENCGMSYGRSFQGLKKISVDPNSCCAGAMVNQATDETLYTLHPTIIDQCLQILSVSASNGLSRRLTKSALPVAIESLFVSSGGSDMQVHGRSEQQSSGILSGDVRLLYGQKVVVSMSKVRLICVDAECSQAAAIIETRWEPEFDLTPKASMLRMDPNNEIWRWNMEVLGIVAIFRILEADEAIQDVETENPNLVMWKQWIHKQAERVRQGKETVYPESQKWSTWDKTKARHFLEKLACLPDENDIVARSLELSDNINQNFKGFADGSISPLEILMEENAMPKYYRLVSKYAGWGYFLSLLSHSNPKLRILEIGAGTGSATNWVLSSLEANGVYMCSNYTFTDISNGFLLQAQEKFSNITEMEYKILDITKDPLDQGFEEHSYDLIIASNVLHATPKLQVTLQHIKQLLADNGYLLLHELNPDTMSTPFLTGLLPGWWCSEEDGRVEQPYVSPERWHEELLAVGFTGSEAMTYDAPPPYQNSFTMISSIAKLPTAPRPVILVTEDDQTHWVQDVVSAFSKWNIVSKHANLHQDPPETHDVVFLLDMDKPFLYDMSEEKFQALKEFMLKLKSPALWITRETEMRCKDPGFGLAKGFLRTVRQELQLELSFMEIDDICSSDWMNALIDIYKKIHQRRDSNPSDVDFEFAYRDGVVHVGRFHWGTLQDQLKINGDEDSPRVLEIGTSLLAGAQWVKASPYKLEQDQVEVDINYVALNFKDIMMAMGLMGSKMQLGCEATGIIRRVAPGVVDILPGDPVVIVSQGLFRSCAVVPLSMCKKLPKSLSAEEAVTMPVVYATAIRSLIDVGSLKKGQSVLIHSACGGVGLASIQICQAVGAQIFCTVGSENKAQHLMDTYGIPRHHIFDSRSVSFYRDLMHQTDGRGADIVLNSLSGELLHTSWRCVAPSGKMIELGKRDILTNGKLRMSCFSQNRSFCGVDLDDLAEADLHRFSELYDEVLKWYTEGKIQPIRPIKTFEASQVLDAFRYMQTGEHMGKILIKMPDDPSVLPGSCQVSSVLFPPDRSFLLVGGLGGIGRSVSRWMVENGARYLVYLCRSTGQSIDDHLFIRELESQGCIVVCLQGNVTILADVQRAVSLCPRPLAGVMQLSLTLKDSAFQQMSHEDWKAVLETKVDGTWNLHHATQNLNLDFFILFSSLGGVKGNIGQANYAAASSFLDAFNTYRHDLDLPCSVLDLGVVEDIGVVSRDHKLLHMMRSSSVQLLHEKDVIDSLHLAILRSRISQAENKPTQVAVGLALSRQASILLREHWAHKDARISAYSKYHERKYTDLQDNLGTQELKSLLNKMRQTPEFIDDEENLRIAKREIVRALVSRIHSAKDVDDEDVHQIAIDSLMAIELRTWLSRNTEITLSVIEISKAGTLGKLADLVIEHLKTQVKESKREKK